MFLSTACEAEQTLTIVTISTASQLVSNIGVSTICNNLKVNKVKPCVVSSCYIMKPAIHFIV